MKFEDGLNYVFAKRKYLYLTLILTPILMFLFSYSFGFIYLTPSFFINMGEFLRFGILNVFLNFLFITVAPLFAATTIAITVFNYFEMKKSAPAGAGLGAAGIFSSMFTSVCPECVPAVLYSAGVTYGIFSAVISPLVIPIKILSISILTISLYLAAKSVGNYCSIKRG